MTADIRPVKGFQAFGTFFANQKEAEEFVIETKTQEALEKFVNALPDSRIVGSPFRELADAHGTVQQIIHRFDLAEFLLKNRSTLLTLLQQAPSYRAKRGEGERARRFAAAAAKPASVSADIPKTVDKASF